MDTKEILEQLTVTALNILSIRPQSEWELRQKLERTVRKCNIDHTVERKCIDQVVETIEQQGYVNDKAFVTWYVEQRLEFRPRSRRRLTVELSRKGIDSGTIAEALSGYDEEVACRRLAYKKQGYPKKQLTDYLLREGFPWDVVEGIINDTRSVS